MCPPESVLALQRSASLAAVTVRPWQEESKSLTHENIFWKANCSIFSSMVSVKYRGRERKGGRESYSPKGNGAEICRNAKLTWFWRWEFSGLVLWFVSFQIMKAPLPLIRKIIQLERFKHSPINQDNQCDYPGICPLRNFFLQVYKIMTDFPISLLAFK